MNKLNKHSVRIASTGAHDLVDCTQILHLGTQASTFSQPDCQKVQQFKLHTFSYTEVIFTKYIKKYIGLLAPAWSKVTQLSGNISPVIRLSKSKSRGKDSQNVTRHN